MDTVLVSASFGNSVSVTSLNGSELDLNSISPLLKFQPRGSPARSCSKLAGRAADVRRVLASSEPI